MSIFTRKRSNAQTLEPTRLSDDLAQYASTLIKPNQITRYTFPNGFKAKVKVISADYARNSATIEYLSDSDWQWFNVPILNEFPIYA